MEIDPKKRQACIDALLLFGIMFLVYVNIINQTYVSDLIAWRMSSGYDTIARKTNIDALRPSPFQLYALGGRPTLWIIQWIYYVLGLCGIDYYDNAWVIKFLFIMLCVLVLIVLVRAISNISKSNFAVGKMHYVMLWVMSLTFVNPLFVDCFSYYSIEWGIGLLFAVMGANYAYKKHYVKAFAFVLLAENTYQNYVFVYMIWLTVFICLSCKDKTFMQTLKDYLISGMLGVATILVNLSIVKIAMLATGQSAVKELQNVAELGSEGAETAGIISAISGIIRKIGGVYYYLNGDYVYPLTFLKSMLGILAIITLGACVVKLFTKKNVVDRVGLVKNYCIDGVGIALLSIYFTLIYIVGGANYSGRILWPCFASFAAIVIIAFDLLVEQKLMEYFAAGFTLMICLVTVYYTSTYISDYVTRCALDSQIAGIIQSEIEEYEAETGIIVKNISVCQSKSFEYSSKYLYLDVPAKCYSPSGKIYEKQWSDVSFINVVTEEYRYNRCEMPEEKYEELFGDEIWDEFNPSEQLVFEGDTLFWAMY